jgi:predicted O-methyltransferase YrrM
MDTKMKTLAQIYDPTISDKGTNQSYITDVYETLFAPFRESAKNILEIGAYDGGSLFMWKEYFPNAMIYGIELAKRVEINDPRIKQIIASGYLPDTLKLIPEELDIAIDDGPHTPTSQITFMELYIKLIKPNGLLIIEDISAEHVDTLMRHIPESHQNRYVMHDLRHRRNGRWDNIMLVITK